MLKNKVVAVLGTGDVGVALSKGFLKLKYKVIMGTRQVDDNKRNALSAKIGDEHKDFTVETFANASKEAGLIVLCVKWDAVKDVTKEIKNHVNGKVLIDVVNPLVFENKVPKLDPNIEKGSAGAYIQNLLSNAFVVKALNTVGSKYMCDANPKNTFPIAPSMFIAGNDGAAKKLVAEILQQWHWEIFDAGGIDKSHYIECVSMLWIDHLFANNFNPDFAFAVVKKK